MPDSKDIIQDLEEEIKDKDEHIAQLEQEIQKNTSARNGLTDKISKENQPLDNQKVQENTDALKKNTIALQSHNLQIQRNAENIEKTADALHKQVEDIQAMKENLPPSHTGITKKGSIYEAQYKALYLGTFATYDEAVTSYERTKFQQER
jgi:chromosome segregation ATPase